MKNLILLFIAALLTACASNSMEQVAPKYVPGSDVLKSECFIPAGSYTVTADTSDYSYCLFATTTIEGTLEVFNNGTVNFTPPHSVTSGTSIQLTNECEENHQFYASYDSCGNNGVWNGLITYTDTLFECESFKLILSKQ